MSSSCSRTLESQPLLVDVGAADRQGPMPIDMLPMPADVLRDAYLLKECNPTLFSEQTRVSMLADMVEDLSSIKDCFVERLRGRTTWERLKVPFRCWWRKSNLLLTLQSVQSVSDSCYATASLTEHHWMEKWRLYEGPRQPGGASVARTAAFKMYQMFNAMCLLQSRKHILREAHARGEGGIPDVLRAARRASRPPPPEARELNYQDCLKATFVESERAEFNPDCPLDPGWLESDLHLVNVLFDEVFKYQEADIKIATETNQVAISNFISEKMVLSVYRDFLSTTIGVLQDQLEVAKTLQTKLMGAAATVLFAVINLFFKLYFEDVMQGALDEAKLQLHG